MSMNGIDISSWQAGIDLSIVPCDFVIVKATQGTDYMNPDFERAMNQAKENGKCIGAYHYSEGGDVIAEADYFLECVNDFVGRAVLALDWEGKSNDVFGVNDFEWVKTFIDYIAEKTNVKPVIYVQQSAMGRFDGIGDYGMWIAQYPDYEITGYQDKLWNEDSYDCAMRQYTATGRLEGYASNLDLNKFYGGIDAWNKYATGYAAPSDDIPVEGEYTVISGDSLWSIAERLYNDGTRYQELKDINGLESDTIYPGQIIKY